MGVQPVAFVIESVALVERRPPVDNPSLLRTEAVVDDLVESANVDAVHESRHGREPRADVVVNPFVGEVQPIAFQVQFVRGAGAVNAAEITGTHPGLAVGGPVGIELNPGVDSANTIEIVGGGIFPVRVNRSNTRLLENIAADAGAGEG